MTTGATTRLAAASHRRIAALLGVRVRRLWRSRLGLLAGVLALLPLWAAGASTPRATIVVATSALLTALLVSAAGAVADDLESGAAMLHALHGASPLDVMLSEILAALAVVAVVALLLLPFAAPLAKAVPLATLVGLVWWAAMLLIGWAALLVLLGCLLPGKGNALVMIVPLGFSSIPAHALPLSDLPAWTATAIRGTWNALPLQAHAIALADHLLLEAPAPLVAPIVLLAAPLVYVALGVLVLSRAEPARRFMQ